MLNIEWNTTMQLNNVMAYLELEHKEKIQLHDSHL
jgi:hypothetical protein